MSKSKVKLVFCKSFVEIPTFRDTFDVDIEVDRPEGFDQVHIIGARVFDNGPSVSTAAQPSGDWNATILEYKDDNGLLGQLLTYVDATYTDPEQRKAHKDIVKQIVYGWTQDMRTRGVQTVDSHLGDPVR